MSDRPHRLHITRTFRRGLVVPDIPEGDAPRHRWYLKDNERIVGPWAPWDLHAAWRNGELRSDALVRREDMDQFIPLRDAWELVDLADMDRITEQQSAEERQLGSGPHPLSD